MSYVIENPAGVDTTVAEQVLQSARLPEDGRLMVLLSPKHAPSLGGGGPYLGLMVADRFRHCAPGAAGIFDPFGEWDYAVGLFQEALDYQHDHPEYLTFLLAHELDHVVVAAETPEDWMLSDLVHNYVRDASGDEIVDHAATPEEVQADKAGKATAISIYGPDPVDETLRQLELAADTGSRRQRFRYLRALDPTPDATSLGTRTRHFGAPFRDQLDKLWSEAKTSGSDPMIDALVTDIEALLDDPPRSGGEENG